VAREFAAELVADGRPPPRLLLAGGRARTLFATLEKRLLDRAAGTALAGITIEENLVLRGVALRAHAESVAPADGHRR
jgi:hypothetical protein